MSLNKIKLSIVIPIYNEEASLASTLKKINKIISTKLNYYCEFVEVIAIDDKSIDKSLSILRKNDDIVNLIIENDKNLGKGASVKKGIQASSGDYIIIQDADDEYDPEDFTKLLNPIIKFKADLVIGSRFLAPEYTRVFYFLNKIGNVMITLLFNILYNTTFTDIYSCYICFNKSKVDLDKIKTVGWEQQAEILSELVKNKSINYEVPISYNGRTYEEGKKIRPYHILSVFYIMIKKRILG